MVKHPKLEDLAALVALMKENHVLQVKLDGMEVVLHPEAFVLAPPAPAEAEPAPKRRTKAEDAPLAPTPETDPTLFHHLS
jgi:hypothetical protein